MVVIGYSGHGLVAAGILNLMGRKVTAYCDVEEKEDNPLNIKYLGNETIPEVAGLLVDGNFFIAIGNNYARKQVQIKLKEFGKKPATIIHPSSIVDINSTINPWGVMVCAGVCINPFSTIEEGAILNTSCIIEHECKVGSFAHIGPGAILCGKVTVGDSSSVGAGAVIKQNITIGKNVVIGAGAVVLKDIGDNICIVGNPAKRLVKVNQKS